MSLYFTVPETDSSWRALVWMLGLKNHLGAAMGRGMVQGGLIGILLSAVLAVDILCREW